jgi:hypothetical protein
VADREPIKELWAIVEVMGHAQYAGRVSEYAALGVPLVRVEIPETSTSPACEKLLGAASIFRITPCDEKVARVAAQQFCVRPLALIALPAIDPTKIHVDDDDEPEDDEFPL